MHTLLNQQPPAFRQFIAVDWSGAKGPRLPGLQVACCPVGQAAPCLVRPPDQSLWTRTSVWEHIIKAAETSGPVLAAFDMGLGLPFADHNAYFPRMASSPPDVRSLWKVVDNHCKESADFYASPFCHPPSPFAPYFNAPGYRGPLFDIQRCRITEHACRSRTRPSSVFNGVGAGAVGLGSLAGMRLLHHAIKAPSKLIIAIWPFDQVSPQTDIVIVEMFPRLYALLAGADPRRWRENEFLPKVLKFYGSRIRNPTQLTTEDEMDAYFSATAIRKLATDSTVWSPPQMTSIAAAHEGWIFGVR